MRKWRPIALLAVLALCSGCVEHRTPTSVSWSLDYWAIFLFNAVVLGPVCCYINFRKGYSLWIGYFAGMIGGCLGLLVCAIIPSRNVPRSSQRLPMPPPGYGHPGYQYPSMPRPGYGPPGYVPPSQQPVGGTAAQAGWYPDPHGRASRRYFDGGRWTDQVVDDQSGQQRSDPV